MSDAYDTIVGKVCIERGWVTREQLVECLRECGSTIDDLSTPATRSRLSDMLVSRGIVQADQMQALREEVSKILANSSAYTVVRKGDTSLGQLLVKGGHAKKEHIIEALSIQQHASTKGGQVPRLGEILISKGYTSFKAIEDALNSQKTKTPLQCASCNAGFQVIDYDPKKKYLCKKCTGPLLPPGQAAPDTPEEVARASQNPKNVLGKYVVVKELGRGGMGAVYKAWDTQLKRWVALKVLVGTGAKDEVARFRREAQTAAALRHPNIVGIFEVTSVAEKHVIAMEYVDGRSLAGERLPAMKSAEILTVVARAVEYAHSRGIIHRDIKPHNIMLDTEEKPFVMDFGLAKSLTGQSHLTMQGTVVGTPSYMAPEQAEGMISQVDKQSDVYSLGAVLYECLTGKPPFKGASPIETMKMVVHDEVKPPTQLAPGVPKDLETIVLKALEKDKKRRYASAKALADDLEHFSRGKQIRATRAPVGAKLARQLQRRWVPVVAIAATALVAILAAILLASAGSGGKTREVRALLQAGDRLLEQGDLQGALVKFASAGELDPSNAALQKRINDTRREIKSSGDLEEKRRKETEKKREDARRAAQPEFDQARNGFTRARTDLYRQGTDLSRVDQALQEVIDHCDKALRISPDHHEARHLRGQAHYLRQDYAAAEKDFTAAIGQLVTFSAAYYDRGRVYLDLAAEEVAASSLGGTTGDEEGRALREKAKSDLNAYKAHGGGDPEQMQIAEAMLAYSEGSFDRVVQACEALIARQTTNEEVYKIQGDALAEQGHRTRTLSQRPELYRKAVAAYTEALAKRVNYPEAYLARGHVLAHSGDKDGANRDLQKAIPIGKGTGGWYSSRGLVLYELGRRPEAIRDFEAALQVRPNDVGVLCNLGLLYHQQKDYTRAIEIFDRALKIDAKSMVALSYRGLARASSGDTGTALADFDAVLAIDPKRAQVLVYRGSVFNMRREWAKADEDLTKYIAAYPTAGEGYYQRGLSRFNQEKFAEALADWEEALRLEIKRPDLEKKIADAKIRLGR